MLSWILNFICFVFFLALVFLVNQIMRSLYAKNKALWFSRFGLIIYVVIYLFVNARIYDVANSIISYSSVDQAILFAIGTNKFDEDNNSGTAKLQIDDITIFSEEDKIVSGVIYLTDNNKYKIANTTSSSRFVSNDIAEGKIVNCHVYTYKECNIRLLYVYGDDVEIKYENKSGYNYKRSTLILLPSDKDEVVVGFNDVDFKVSFKNNNLTVLKI